MSQQQKSNVTFRGRHARLMREVAGVLPAQGFHRPHVLSFGCANGDECLDLASIFPDGYIYGCDVKPEMIATATERCPGMTIFESTPAEMERQGSFEAVFALNVLLRHPATAGLDDISGVYPFAEFDETITAIDAALEPGGVIALYNGQYFFEDTSVARGYRPLTGGRAASNAWVEKALPDGRRATDCLYTFEGTTRDRAAWSAWLRQGDNRQRAMIDGFDEVAFRHEWRDTRWAEGRSTQHAIWIKADAV